MAIAERWLPKSFLALRNYSTHDLGADLLAGLTVGFFMAHSVASGWVGRLALQDRSHASSLYLLTYYMGASVLGSAGGWFWRWGGWPAVTGYCAAAMLGVLALGLALRDARAASLA